MSEYQYYEFQAIDRPLTRAEQEEVAKLSSRVDPHPTTAVFVYHYSGLRGNPTEILAKYYDAFFYIANWGSIKLSFRFPKSTLILEEIKPYCVDDVVSYEEKGAYILLHFEFNTEEWFDWTEGDGYLSQFLPLRQAIMERDYRLLYLGWLSMLSGNRGGADVGYNDHEEWDDEEEWDEEDDDDNGTEPPVPAGLKQLDTSLQQFIQLFQINPFLVQAAAEASPPRNKTAEPAWESLIAKLPPAEQQKWLLRLAKGETNLTTLFRRHLAPPQAMAVASSSKRTSQQLLNLAHKAQQAAEARQKAQAEAERIKNLQQLAPRKTAVWLEVKQLLERKTSSSYDLAVEKLEQLHELAIYQQEEAKFSAQVRELRANYTNRPAFLRKLNEAKLP